MKTFGALLGLFAIIGMVFGLVFAIYYGLIWVFCWAFGIAFSVKYVFGVWATTVLFSIIFKSKK